MKKQQRFTRSAIALACASFLFPMSAAWADSAKLTFNGHSYQRFDTAMKWTDAKVFCENKGAHLATITSQAENDFVVANFVSSSVPIILLGASDVAKEGTWQWITGEAWSYTNWHSGEPNNGGGVVANENYLAFHSLNGLVKWNDIQATSNPPLCEWDGTTTISAPTCVLTPTPSTITAGQSATLTATCTPAATSYQWSDTACASTSSTCTVTPNITTNYSVKGGNSGGMGVASPSVGVTVTAAVTPVQKIEAAAAWVAPGEATKLLVTPSTATLSNCSSSDTNIATVNGQSIVGVKRGDSTITCNGASTTISVRLPWVTDINPKQAVIGETTIFTVTGQDLNIGYLNFALPNCIGEGVPVWDLTPDTVSLQLILSGLQERKFVCMPVATGTQFAKVHAVSLPSINYADRRLSAQTSPVFFGNNCALSGNCAVNFVSGGSITDKVAISAVIDSILNPYKINGVVPWWRLTSAQIQTIQKQFRDNNISTAFPAAHSAAMKAELAGLDSEYKRILKDVAGAVAAGGYTWQDKASAYTVGYVSTLFASYSATDWIQLTGGMALNGALAISDAYGVGHAVTSGTTAAFTKFGKYAGNVSKKLKSVPVVAGFTNVAKKINSAEKLSALIEVGAAGWNAWGSDENIGIEIAIASTKVAGADKLKEFLKIGKGEMDEVIAGIAAKILTEIVITSTTDAVKETAKSGIPSADIKTIGSILEGVGDIAADAAIASLPMVSSWVDMGKLSSQIADRAFGKYFQDNVDTVHEDFRARDAAVLRRYTLQNLIRISSEAENALVNAGVNTALADTNCLFTWAESRHPNLFSPANPPTQTSDYGDVFRLYPSTKTALGVKSDRNVEAYQEKTYETKIYPLGPLSDWLPTVKAASCR